jgi:hypothetical protein
MNLKINYQLEGFPTQVGEKLNLPNIGSLQLQPMFMAASANDVYKHGGEILRNLLNSTPLKNNKKHVVVTTYTQFLVPGFRAVLNKNGFEDEWHVDASISPLTSTDTIHLLTSECSALTEFNKESVILDVEENINTVEFANYLTSNSTSLNIVPQKMEPNRFITFGRHAHRATNPKEHELRFFFRVAESDHFEPRTIDKSRMRNSNIFKDGKIFINVEHTKEGIFIHNPNYIIRVQ